MKPTYFAFVALVLFSAATVHATVINAGGLNIIDDAGNPSEGLQCFDMTFSDSLTQAAALANAQATYSNARLATASKFNNLFAAATWVTYRGALTASAAFDTCGTVLLATRSPGVGLLTQALGLTDAGPGRSFSWTDPESTNQPLLHLASCWPPRLGRCLGD
jgi:hypothetical protein